MDAFLTGDDYGEVQRAEKHGGVDETFAPNGPAQPPRNHEARQHGQLENHLPTHRAAKIARETSETAAAGVAGGCKFLGNFPAGLETFFFYFIFFFTFGKYPGRARAAVPVSPVTNGFLLTQKYLVWSKARTRYVVLLADQGS